MDLLLLLPILLLAGLVPLIAGRNDDDTDSEEPQRQELSEGDDTFSGSAGSDLVEGLGGYDIIDGRGGDDSVWGGADDDIVTGGDGDDRLWGEAGDDSYGDPAWDNDGRGDDLARGGAGNDVLVDLDGSDTLYGDTGSDTLIAVDLLRGAADTLSGGSGQDRLTGDDGDTMSGGQGEDSYALVPFDYTADCAPGAPITITDHEPGEWVVAYVQMPDSLPHPTAALRLSEDGEDTEITVGTHVIAVLRGVTDPGTVNFRLELE